MFLIRSFEPTDAEYDAVAAIERAVWPDTSKTADIFRHRDASHDPQYLFQRLVIPVNDEIIAFAEYGETAWSYEPGKYYFGIAVHPHYERRGIGSVAYDHIVSALRRREPKPQLLVTHTREDKPQSIRFLEKRRFQSVMRWIISELDLATYDDARFAGLEEKLCAQGIQIRPLPDLQSSDSDWQHKIWELDWALTLDEPLPSPPTKRPFQQFLQQEFEDPNFWPQGWFIALDRGRYVGMSQINQNEADPEQFRTGFTGVARGYRRRGIATALKLRAIDVARQAGAKSVRAGNEESNPMYQINVQLGFQMVTASVAYEKTLA